MNSTELMARIEKLALAETDRYLERAEDYVNKMSNWELLAFIARVQDNG